MTPNEKAAEAEAPPLVVDPGAKVQPWRAL
jgi:hypothetical protein